jgi:hypothetical protein
MSEQKQYPIRTEPRVSKSGTVRFTFWDETPMEIRQELETHAMKWVPEEGEYTYTAKENSSGGMTVFWNDRKEQEITGQKLPDTPRRFTRAASTYNKPTNQEWAERDAKKSEQIQKLHDETLDSTNRLIEVLGHIDRKLEDLCFILGEQNKVKGGA